MLSLLSYLIGSALVHVRKRWVKVEIECPHGAFIPSAYRPWKRKSARLLCEACGVLVRLTTRRGEVDW